MVLFVLTSLMFIEGFHRWLSGIFVYTAVRQPIDHALTWCFEVVFCQPCLGVQKTPTQHNHSLVHRFCGRLTTGANVRLIKRCKVPETHIT